MINLFPDQSELIESVATEMRAGTRAILMQAATGSGKSIMAAEILRRARAKNKTVLFTVPRRELLKQMGRTFNNFDITHSYIAAGMSFNPHSMAHISSTDTLRRRLEKLRAPDLAVIDETHFGSNGLDEIIKWLKKSGSYIIGLSATPWKLSGQGLGCWYDKMICGPDIRWLVDNGRLSDYRAFLAPRLDLSQIEIVGGDYNKAKLGDRMRLIIGDAVKHYRQHAYGKLNITYCVSIEESKRTAAAFNDAGIPTAHLDGETPDEEKTRIIRAYANRELLNICNNELLTFGFDLASWIGRDVCIESMSDLRPTKSLALQRQKNGRALRYKPEPALIFDHASNISEHGQPDMPIDWTLADRETDSRRGGTRATPIAICKTSDGKGCFYSYSAHLKSCPSCGLVREINGREIEQIEGDLVEMERQQIQIKKAARMEVGKARTLSDLKRIAAERDYAPGWIYTMQKLKGITE